MRFRHVDTPDDIPTQAKIQRMRKTAMRRMCDLASASEGVVPDTWSMFQDRESIWHVPGPGSASTAPEATSPQQFIDGAHRRPLWVAKLQ